MIAHYDNDPVAERGNLSPAEALRQPAAIHSTPSHKTRTRVTAFGLAPGARPQSDTRVRSGKEVKLTTR